jgi:opacity protein-like surface antigen
MKKFLTIAALATLAAAVSTAAQAQSVAPWSAELGYSALSVRDGANGLKWNPSTLRAVVGYDLHRNLAIEGLAAFGVDSDASTNPTGLNTVRLEVRQSYGLFLKPRLQLDDRTEVFGRLGWTETTVIGSSTSQAGVTNSQKRRLNDGAWGAGVNYRFATKAYVGLDYMNSYEKDGIKVDAVTVSVGTRF